jgi:hypothetical protein
MTVKVRFTEEDLKRMKVVDVIRRLFGRDDWLADGRLRPEELELLTPEALDRWSRDENEHEEETRLNIEELRRRERE